MQNMKILENKLNFYLAIVVKERYITNEYNFNLFT